MEIAKIFTNGRSQAVRLPKEYRFQDDEVLIQKVGDVVMIYPKSSKWANLLNGINMISSDFMEDGRAEQGTNKDIDL